MIDVANGAYSPLAEAYIVGTTGHTNVYVRLVSCEGGIVPYTIHPPARALRTQRILHRRYATLILQRRARSAQEDSRKARHD